MHLPTFAYGYDYGNAETCGVLIDTVQRSKVLPSFTAQGSLSELARKRSASGAPYAKPVHALETDEHVLSLADKEYFVGDLAARESKTATTKRGDVTRYWSESSLHLLLTSSGLIVPHKEYELYVVTGLPVETFTTENRQKVREALTGEHVFTLDGERRKAIIHVTQVVMEGAGAMIKHGMAEQVPQGCIDIGGRTTDLYASIGQKPRVSMCQGKEFGVESVVDLLNVQLMNQLERQLQPSEAKKIIRAYLNHTQYPLLFADGKQINSALLERWTMTAIQEIGTNITSFVSLVWGTTERGSVASDFAKVLIVGGGAHYFAPHIKRVIKYAQVPDFPEKANAEGYAALASHLLHQISATQLRGV